jgi:hypothetical protein
MNRFLPRLGILVFLLALVVGVIFYLQVPRHETPFKNAAKADAFELSQGTSSVRLVHASSWTVQLASSQFPADTEKVKSAVSSLSTVQIEDEISDRADRAAEFEVNSSSGIKVTLYQKNKAVAEGVFGKQAPDFMHIYFCRPGKPGVFLARGLIRGEIEPVEPSAWRSRDVLNVAEADIQSVEIASGDHPLSLKRSSDTWSLNDQPVDSTRVYTLLGTLAHLKAEDFMDPAASPPALTRATITVKATSGATVLHLGAAEASGKRAPMTIDGVSGAFWISEDKAKSILVKPSDFPPAKK